jgi:hypothetical protein
MTQRTSLANASHVQEGRARFGKPAEANLFETAEEIAARDELYHGLEFFPTPPWAVRAVLDLLPHFAGATVLEPCAGRGHMVEPLRQAGCAVHASDIHDHGLGYDQLDFAAPLSPEVHDRLTALDLDLVMTNPPFRLSAEIIRNGLKVAPDVLVLCRLSFLCTASRYDLHRDYLDGVYVSVERIPMVLGRYDPQATTATEYAWFHFKREGSRYYGPIVAHIPPGSRERFQRPEDVRL